MKWALRITLAFVVLLAGLLVLLIASSYLFNLATNGETKPVQKLWHGRFVTADGVLTAYREWSPGAKGTPIVLIGGFLEPTFVWEEVAPLLAKAGHPVYALDLDGFGYTERRGPWTLDEWAAQVAGFMSALRIEKPIVVGHSLGAAVALDVVRRGLVSRVVLVDGDGLTTGGPPGFLRRALTHTPLITSALRLSTDWDWPVTKILERAYGPGHPKLDHALVDRWTKQFKADGAEHAMGQMVKHGLQGFARSQLRAIRVPATVVWGSKDGVDTVGSGRRTADDLQARFVVVSNAGHLGIATRPGAYARAIERQP